MLPENTACVWTEQFALLTDRFLKAQDDDDHTFQWGVPVEICLKTHRVLEHESYRPYFGIINRSAASGSDGDIICEPTSGCC